MINSKIETEDSLLSITKHCETLVQQTHRKAEQTLEFKLTKSRKTFLFNPPIPFEGSWMLELTNVEVYNSIFNITEENNKFELYKSPDSKSGGVSYEKVRDETERDLNISYITAVDLQDAIIGPIIIKEYREQVSKRMKYNEYMRILANYISSIFQDFEIFSEQKLIWLKMILDWF